MNLLESCFKRKNYIFMKNVYILLKSLTITFFIIRSFGQMVNPNLDYSGSLVKHFTNVFSAFFFTFAILCQIVQKENAREKIIKEITATKNVRFLFCFFRSFFFRTRELLHYIKQLLEINMFGPSNLFLTYPRAFLAQRLNKSSR